LISIRPDRYYIYRNIIVKPIKIVGAGSYVECKFGDRTLLCRFREMRIATEEEVLIAKAKSI
jgi:hypothetical protein